MGIYDECVRREAEELTKYQTAREIEIAIAQHLDQRVLCTVPNVSWGFLNHEADLLSVTRSGYAWEVEIKVTKHDILRDKEKRHGHRSHKVRCLWFAIPEKLEDCVEYVPGRAGVFIVSESGRVRELRQPMPDPAARKLSDRELFKVARLGCLRVWNLKRQLRELRQVRAENRNLRKLLERYGVTE